MKLLFLYPLKGQNNFSNQVMSHGLLNQLKMYGHDIYVITKNDVEKRLAIKLGIKYFFYKKNIFFKLACFMTTNKFPRIAINGLLRKVKNEGIQIILERHKLFNIGFQISILLKIPYVTNDVLVSPDWNYYGSWFTKQLYIFPLFNCHFIIKRADIIPLRYSDAIISHSIAYTDQLINIHEVDKNKIFQFYAMVNSKLFRPIDYIKCKQKLNIKDNLFHICYVGSFDKLHSTENLLPIIKEATRRCKNINFLLAGDGPMLDKLKKDLYTNNLENYVTFFGRLSREEINAIINASDICIEVIWNERVLKYGADSIKVYEYMACEKPVIVSDLPGQIQILKTENAGILVDPTNYLDFTDKILYLLNNPKERERIAKNALKLINDRWNWDYTGEIINNALNYALRRDKK